MADRAESILEEWLNRFDAGRDGRIPAERVLAAELGLSRAELRKGLAALEAENRLVRHVGRGTFLRPVPTRSVRPDPPAAERDAGNAGLADAVSPRDLLQARLALEPELARLAALHGTGRHIAALREAGAAVSAAATWAAYDEADAAFHRALAQASGNVLLLALFDTAATVRREIAWGLLLQRDGEPGPDHGSIAEHAAVVEAVAKRDRRAAADALRHHLLVEAAALLGAGV